jgi:hypothetical protein
VKISAVEPAELFMVALPGIQKDYRRTSSVIRLMGGDS